MPHTDSPADANRICEALQANDIPLTTLADVANLPLSAVESQLSGGEPLDPATKGAAYTLLEAEKAKCLQKASIIYLAQGNEKMATILEHILEGDCVITAEWEEERIVFPGEA